MSADISTKRYANRSLLFAIGFLSILALVAGALFWIVVFSFCLTEVESASVDGPAPQGDFAVRRSWGEKNLGNYFAAAEAWVRHNREIENDIGRVVGVAPVDGPNRFCSGFGESWATMNLEIIGEKGEGVLALSEVSFEGRGDRVYVEVSKDPWQYHVYEPPD